MNKMRTNEEKHFEREFFYMAHGNLSYRSFFGMIIHFTIWSLVSGHWSLSIPLENITKPLVF